MFLSLKSCYIIFSREWTAPVMEVGMTCPALPGGKKSLGSNCSPLFFCLKQYRFIILEFCRSDVWHGSHCAKIKVSTRLYSFLEALEEKPFSHFSQLLEAAYILWLSIHFSPFKGTVAGQIHLTLHYFDLFFCVPFSLLRTLVITLGPPR